MTKQPTTKPKRTEAGRVRAPLAAAVTAIVTRGLSIADAAQEVGMARESLSRALRKPHVQALRAGVKRAWLTSKTDLAWVQVAKLAADAQSEDVRLKAAKTILDAAGELKREGGDDRSPKSLVQIVMHHAPAEMTTVGGNRSGIIEIIRQPNGPRDPFQVIEAPRA